MTAGPTDRSNQQNPNKPPFVPALSDIAIEFKPGDIVGGAYEIIDLLGQGGMGNIYRARHNIMLEEYALKTLRAEKLTDVSWKRFQKEAQAIGRMNHPNIVAIYNFGLHEGTVPYYVMAQLQGKTLEKLIADGGPLPLAEALPIFVEVCIGMGYAHKKGIVHRDVKPPNIVVLDQGQAGSRVKIVDFGIVKLSEDAGSNQQLTNIGEVCGSPYYMSPEQCEASTIDARSDVYSLGCTLFEVLTGAPPFRGRNVVDTMLKHQSAVPATLQAASGGKAFPPMLEQVVAKMLAKSPSDRYQTMEEAASDLQTIIDSKDTRVARAAGVSSSTTAPGVSSSTMAPAQQTVSPQRAASQEALLETSTTQSARPATELTDRRRETKPAPLSPDHDLEPEPYQTTIPPHFLRLMVGVFFVVTMTMAALGYWWVQQKPSTRPSSPTSVSPIFLHSLPLQQAPTIAAKA
jgi:serine/threonine-protein kinase